MKTLLAILLTLAPICAKSAPAGEEVVYKKVGDRELHLYIIKPDGWKASDQRPAIVWLHGGGWVGGPVDQFEDQVDITGIAMTFFQPFKDI